MEELSARLLELAQSDELTGLQNRRGLTVAGNRLLQFADSRRADIGVLFADVENVMELNERLGHHAGDAALQAVARALSVTFSRSDVLARIGGAQFLVLALNLSEPHCGTVTRRIEAHLADPATTEFVGAEVGGLLRLDDAATPATAGPSPTWWPGPIGPCSRRARPGRPPAAPRSATPDGPSAPPTWASPPRGSAGVLNT